MPILTFPMDEVVPFFNNVPEIVESFFKETYPDGSYPAAVQVFFTYYLEFKKNALDEGAENLTLKFDTSVDDESYTLSISSDASTGFNEHFKENIPPDARQQLEAEAVIPYSAVLQDRLIFPSIKMYNSQGGFGMGMSLTNALLRKFEGELLIQEKSGKVFFHLSSINRLVTSEETRSKKRMVDAEFRAACRPSSDQYVPTDFKLEMPTCWISNNRKTAHPRSPSSSSSPSVASPNTKRRNPFSHFQESCNEESTFDPEALGCK